MSTNVGSIVATVAANTQQFTSGLADSAAQLETFAKKMKKLSNDFALVGGAVTAAAIGMVKSAASINVNADVAFKHFEAATKSLAVQVSQAAIPALNEMAKQVRSLADWFASLSPEQRKHITDLILLAAQVTVAALAFGRFMEVLHGVAGVASLAFNLFSGGIGIVRNVAGAFASMFGGVTLAGMLEVVGVLTIILAAVAVIAGAVYVLRKAWIENWGGIQDAVKSVIETISGWWTDFVTFLGGLWQGMVDDFASKLKAIVALFYSAQVAMGQMNPKIAGVQMGAMNTAIDAAAGVAKDPKAVQSLVLQAAETVKNGASNIVKDLEKMAKDAADAVKGYLGIGATGGHAGSGRDRTGELTPYSEAVAKAIASSLDYQTGNHRISSTSASKGGGMLDKGGIDFTTLMDLFKEKLAAAWDAGDIVGAFKTIGDVILASATDLSQVTGALKVAGESFVQNTGKLGQTISAGIQGFQQGGIWGALIAVIMQFVTSCKGWTQIMNIGNGQFQQALNEMGKGLGNLLNGLQPLMGAIEFIASAIHQILAPVFTLIGTILKGIAPIFTVIGVALQVLAGTLGPLIQIIGGILDPLFKLMAATLSPLVILFMYLKVAVDGISLGFNMFIDWVDKFFGSNNAGGVADASAQFEKDKASADSFALSFLNDPFNALNNLNQASADAAGSIGAMGDAAASATEQLLNVPTAYKIAEARYMSSGQSSTIGPTAIPGTDSRWQQYRATGNPVQQSKGPRKK